MIEFVLDHKWYFFIVGEVIFWSSLIGFMLLRYAFNLKKLGKYSIILWLASDLWLVTIGVIDYMRTGTFDQFQIIIVIFVIYALTAGKEDFKRLDRWIQKKVSRWKGNPEPKFNEPQPLGGKEHARSQRKKFYFHLLIFIAIQVVFILFTDYNLSSISELIHKLDSVDSDNSNQVMKIMSGISGISLIWTIFLFIHFIISFSYSLSPQKENKG